MRRLALYLAIGAVLVASAFAAQIMWGSAAQPSAADHIVWSD
jgi:hypothetical protein